MRSVKTVPCRTQEWDFCYNPYSVLPTKGAPVNIYVGHSKRTVTRVYLNTPIRSYEVHYVENVSTSS